MSKQNSVPSTIKVFGFQVERVLPQPPLSGEHCHDEPWRFESVRDLTREHLTKTSMPVRQKRSSGHRN